VGSSGYTRVGYFVKQGYKYKVEATEEGVVKFFLCGKIYESSWEERKCLPLSISSSKRICVITYFARI